MAWEKIFARSMSMDEATWIRHASPWSVYTRIPILPVLISLIWFRYHLGATFWPAVATIVLWTWYNPRAFRPPQSTKSWAAKGTFGERVWMNRKKHPIPKHHEQWALALSLGAGLFLFLCIYGLIAGDFWMTFLSCALSVLFKLWFIDRMVWLYQDMQHIPEYKQWLR